jgi:2-hydroxy-5-methyl-1-naphthoate 7-hydroxylase
MQVICEMFGVPEEWRPKLREAVQATFDSTITSEIYLKTQEERIELLRKLVELHREEPGDDLTSAAARRRARDHAKPDHERRPATDSP